MKVKVRLRDVLLGLYPTPPWLATALRGLGRDDREALVRWASAPTEASGRCQSGRRRGVSEWGLRVQLAHALRELGLNVVVGHADDMVIGRTVTRTVGSPALGRPRVKYRIQELAVLMDTTYWSTYNELKGAHVPIRRGWVYVADLAQRAPWVWESLCLVYGWTDELAALTSPLVAV